MSFVTATRDFESWLAGFFPLHERDLAFKHERMAHPRDPFPFLRGTYYRWVKLWPKASPAEAAAPRVLGVGDLHVENFGLWRDSDGRLCWGVNDFDEADDLPYTNDLVRLAASVRLARMGRRLHVKFRRACHEIIVGYRHVLESGGLPFVLEERHPELRKLGMASEREPKAFWEKMTAVLRDPEPALVPEARDALTRNMPDGAPSPQIRFRSRVGMGSLGKPRYIGLTEWAGGWIAREVKAVTPSATAWLSERAESRSRIAEIVGRAVRSPDPYYRPGEKWVARRLAPRCSRIELGSLAATDDVCRVLWAMGGETANVHLGTLGVADAILKDLSARPEAWLADAGRASAKAVLREWREWQNFAAKGSINR